jgi:hypothetical protein
LAGNSALGGEKKKDIRNFLVGNLREIILETGEWI